MSRYEHLEVANILRKAMNLRNEILAYKIKIKSIMPNVLELVKYRNKT